MTNVPCNTGYYLQGFYLHLNKARALNVSQKTYVNRTPEILLRTVAEHI